MVKRKVSTLILSITITTDNLTVNEKTQTVATLISNQDDATFSLDGSSDNNDLFKIENVADAGVYD
jgi:hypothetical protein